jgi:hypothetical protein
VLSHHRFDNANSKSADKGKKKRKRKKLKNNHLTSMLNYHLHSLKESGHITTKCRYKDKPKEELVINKTKQKEEASHQQQQQQPATNTTQPSSATNSAGLAGVHIRLQLYKAIGMKDFILLDNQATASIFCNKDLVDKVYKSDEPMILKTNWGDLVTDMKATVKDFGEVQFNPNAVTNIFSMAEMENKYKISYKSGEFIVHLPHSDAIFKKDVHGLYMFKPPQLNYSSKEFSAHQHGKSGTPVHRPSN